MHFLAFTRPHDLTALGTALWSAFPQWFYTDADGRLRTDVTLSGDGQDGWIMFPDTTSVAAVEAAINAYRLPTDLTITPPVEVDVVAQIPRRPIWQYLLGAGWMWNNAP